jgi:hypothetical protein
MSSFNPKYAAGVIMEVPHLREAAGGTLEGALALLERMDVIQYQHSSLNSPVGKGSGEKLAAINDPEWVDRSGYDRFQELKGRSVLSNFANSRIELNGRLYPRPENAYHAAKGLMVGTSAMLVAAKEFEIGGKYDNVPAATIERLGGKNGPMCLNPSQIVQWTSHSVKVMMFR